MKNSIIVTTAVFKYLKRTFTVMILDPIRLVIGGMFLFHAAILDIKTRRVPNKVWVIMGAIGVILLHVHIMLEGQWYHHLIFLPLLALYTFPFIELEAEMNLKHGTFTPTIWYFMIIAGFAGAVVLAVLGGTGFFTLTLIGMVIFILLVYVMYFTGLIFGGADAKGMMAITLFVPFYPAFSIFPLFGSDIRVVELIFTFPVVILTLSVIIFAFLPLVLAGFNLTRGDVGAPMFFGYRMSLKEIADKYVWLMEKPQYKDDPDIKLMTMVGEAAGIGTWLKEQSYTGEIKMIYFPVKNASESLDADLSILEKEGRERVWVTPKIPFMVAIFGGYIASFIFGNLLFELMDRIMG